MSEVVRLLVVADKDGHLRRAANALAWLVVEPIWEGKSFKWDPSDARLQRIGRNVPIMTLMSWLEPKADWRQRMERPRM